MIGFPHLFLFFFFSEKKKSWLGLCNHLAENKEAEGEMLSECSLTMIVVNKASI